MSLERIVKMSTPFDKRHSDPHKDYGISSMRIWMILKGERHAVQFVFNTGMFQPEISDELFHDYVVGKKNAFYGDSSQRLYNPFRGGGWDVGFHSLDKPGYMDEDMAMRCDVFEEGHCFYDGSSLRAEGWFDKAVHSENFQETIWKMLEEEYEVRFGK